jgi:hypothetical protein
LPVAIEFFQKGILLRFLQKSLVIECGRQAFGEGRFTHADRAFNGNV